MYELKFINIEQLQIIDKIKHDPIFGSIDIETENNDQFRKKILRMFNEDFEDFSRLEFSNKDLKRITDPEINGILNKSQLKINYQLNDEIHEFEWNLLSNIIFRNYKEANKQQIDFFLNLLRAFIKDIRTNRINIAGKSKYE